MKLKFKRLIKKYSKEYIIEKKQGGDWNGPVWDEGNKNKYQIQAAIFPLTPEDIDRYEGLGYTTQDIKIFIPASNNEIEALNLETEEYEFIVIKENDRIEYKNNNYVFDQLMDRTTYSDFIKWISVRDQNNKEDDNND